MENNLCVEKGKNEIMRHDDRNLVAGFEPTRNKTTKKVQKLSHDRRTFTGTNNAFLLTTFCHNGTRPRFRRRTSRTSRGTGYQRRLADKAKSQAAGILEKLKTETQVLVQQPGVFKRIEAWRRSAMLAARLGTFV